MSVYRVSFWQDIGYLEGSAETPLPSSSLSTPDYIWGGTSGEILQPSKGRYFSQLKIKKYWAGLLNMSYMKIEYLVAAHVNTLDMYAWIDSVEITSDTADYPVTTINFHIDLWRTYISQVTLKRGVVLRRPYVANTTSTSESALQPPQQVDSIKQYVDTDNVTSLIPLSKLSDSRENSWLWYVLFTYTDENSSGNETLTRLCFFPVAMDNDPVHEYGTLEGFSTYNIYQAPTLWDVMSGRWDEKLGLTPSRIKCAWLSPVPPSDYYIQDESGTANCFHSTAHIDSSSYSPYWDMRSNVYTEGSTSVTYGFFITQKNNTFYKPAMTPTYTASLSSPVIVTDLDRYVVTDFEGAVVGDLPYGVALQNYDYRLIVDSVTAYIDIRFTRNQYARCNNMDFVVPLIPLEVTENSWSEYNYTGAREYDRAQRQAELNYQRSSAYTDALTQVGLGAGTSLMSIGAAGIAGGIGAGAGASSLSMAGKLGYGLSSQAGNAGLIGFSQLLSGADSLVSTYTHEQMGIEEKYNMELDRLSNQYQAKKSDAMLIAGGGFDMLTKGQTVSLYKLSYDSYSRNRFTAKMAQFGAEVFEPFSTSYSMSAGPLQIDNLTVTGDVPVDAKLYIANRLKRGVILV